MDFHDAPSIIFAFFFWEVFIREKRKLVKPPNTSLNLIRDSNFFYLVTRNKGVPITQVFYEIKKGGKKSHAFIPDTNLEKEVVFKQWMKLAPNCLYV